MNRFPADLRELLEQLEVGMPVELWTEVEIEALETRMQAAAIEAGNAMRKLEARIQTTIMIEDPEELRRLMAEGEELRARFAFLHQFTKGDPFRRDFLIIASTRFIPTARAAAIERLAALFKNAGPYHRNRRAWRSLYKMAGALRLEPVELLHRALESAVERAVVAAEEPHLDKQSDGRWVKRRAARVETKAAREYGLATPEFRRWFERTVRSIIEKTLIAAVEGLEAEDKTAAEEEIEPAADDAAEVADAELRLRQWWDQLTSAERAAVEDPESKDRDARARARKKFR